MVVRLEDYSSSPQCKVILDCYRAALRKDLSAFHNALHEDLCIVKVPRSPELPPLNRDAFLGRIAYVLKIVTFDVTFHSIVDSPGKVVLHSVANVSGLPQSGVDDSIWTITFVTDDQGNPKIKYVEQFANNDLGLFQEAMAK